MLRRNAGSEDRGRAGVAGKTESIARGSMGWCVAQDWIYGLAFCLLDKQWFEPDFLPIPVYRRSNAAHVQYLQIRAPHNLIASHDVLIEA